MRAYLGIWIAAIALVLILVLGINAQPFYKNLRIPDTPILFIGSSLFRHAIPSQSDSDTSILGDGRAHIRINQSAITEQQALELIDIALSSSVSTLFIEIYPFCRDSAKDRLPPLSLLLNLETKPFIVFWAQALLTASMKFRDNFRDNLTPSSRRTFEYLTGKPDFRQRVLNLEDIKGNYPFFLHSPHHPEKLQQLLEKAKSVHTQVVFIAPPRSSITADFISKADVLEFQQHVREVAAGFNTPLIDVNEFWPSQYFVDQAHINQAGRDRFIRRLKHEWDKLNER